MEAHLIRSIIIPFIYPIVSSNQPQSRDHLAGSLPIDLSGDLIFSLRGAILCSLLSLRHEVKQRVSGCIHDDWVGMKHRVKFPTAPQNVCCTGLGKIDLLVYTLKSILRIWKDRSPPDSHGLKIQPPLFIFFLSPLTLTPVSSSIHVSHDKIG